MQTTRSREALIRKWAGMRSLAESGKFQRLRNAPGKYLKALWIQYISFRLFSGTLRVQMPTFFGPSMVTCLPSGTDIYLTGGKSHPSEIRLARFMMEYLQPGDIILDVGAHIGFFSLLASVLTSEKGSVYSLEASKETLQLLKQNTRDQANISVFHLAASNKNQQITFTSFPTLQSEYNSLRPELMAKESWYKDRKEEQVQGIRLDAFIEREKISPHFIKIDVEGAEDLVIEGLSNEGTDPTHLCIAMEYLSGGKGGHHKAHQTLLTRGFKAHKANYEGLLVPIQEPQQCLRQSGLDSENIIYYQEGHQRCRELTMGSSTR